MINLNVLNATNYINDFFSCGDVCETVNHLRKPWITALKLDIAIFRATRVVTLLIRRGGIVLWNL